MLTTITKITIMLTTITRAMTTMTTPALAERRNYWRRLTIKNLRVS
jgi:hypothetical protein